MPFFLIKTDNALILYIFISLIYAVYFAMIEKMDSRVRGNDIWESGNDRGEIALAITEGVMRLLHRVAPMTEGWIPVFVGMTYGDRNGIKVK